MTHDQKNIKKIKGGSTEASRCQNNNSIFCIQGYFVLQLVVTTIRHIQSQMNQTVQMWNKKIVRKRMVIGSKNARCNVKLEMEG